MKRLWKETLAAIALAYLAGTALAQQVPMGLPPGPSDIPRQSVIPGATPPPPAATPSTPATPATPTIPTTQAPPLANPTVITSAPVAAQVGADKKIGSAKTDPPPECCPPICCPAPGPMCCPAPAPICCPAPGPVVCQDNIVTEGQDCHRKWHWEVGAGIYYIQPNFKTNPAFLTLNTANGNTILRQNDFRYHMNAAPLSWVGVTSDCGLGIRARWFQFDQGASESITSTTTTGAAAVNAFGLGLRPLAPGETLAVNSRLRVDVWDLELTQSFTCCKWNLLVGGGVRYANMQQNYQSTQTSAPNSDNVTTINSVIGSHTFNGAGPSLALESRRRLGDCGLALYGNMRGSVLFGTSSTGGTASTQVFFGGVAQPPGGSLQSQFQQADVLPIGEIEVGVEYGRDMGKAHLFAQLGFVGQVWFGAGNAALVDLGGITTNNNSNFGFVGAAFRAGVAY